jgi:hypothetical protein
LPFKAGPVCVIFRTQTDVIDVDHLPPGVS